MNKLAVKRVRNIDRQFPFSDTELITAINADDIIKIKVQRFLINNIFVHRYKHRSAGYL